MSMTESNITPSRHFTEIREDSYSGESAIDGEIHLPLQLNERGMTSHDLKIIIDKLALLSSQLERLERTVQELNERNSVRSSEGNIASERSASSGRGSDRWVY